MILTKNLIMKQLLIGLILFNSVLVSQAQSIQTGAEFIGQKRTQYDLYVRDTIVNFTGKTTHAIAINGQIPGPTIDLTQGDTAVIRVHNLMSVATSIHWHGILIPNQFDGVPGLTTFPIKPDSTLTVVFPVRQNGTYWYHSHTMTQEQIGLTGSIVIHKKNEIAMKEEVVVLNDWTNIKPSEVWRLLKRQTDYFAIRKNSVQSYGEALAAGHLVDKVKQEWKRMPGMDISDVKYNLFLTNGKPTFDVSNYKAGDSIRLRIINASSSSYFWIQYAGGKMKVIAADGQDVQPVEVDKFLISTAETYDVIIHIPSLGKYELRATAQDISGYTSAYFGGGNLVPAATIPKVDYFKIMHHMNTMMSSMNMKMGASKLPMTNIEVHHDNMPMNNMQMGNETTMKKNMPTDDMSMTHDSSMKSMNNMNMNNTSMKGKMNMNEMDNMKTMKMGGMNMYGFDYPPGNGNDKVLSYKMLKAANNDPAIPKPQGEPDRIIQLTATGNMFRYVWSFNNVVLSDADKILIKNGEHVRVIFHNNTMMEHPLHLHGHFFRLNNGTTVDEAPLKHTFNLLPMATDTIDYLADEEKDWFFHCHNLYHMLSGMARTFHYENTIPEVQRGSPKNYKDFLSEQGHHIFLWGASSFQSQGNFTNFTVAGTKWELNEELKWNYKNLYESETSLRRFIDKRQFLTVFVGTDNRRQKTDVIKNGKNINENKNLATAGLTYFLPLLITAEGRIDNTGHVRFQLQRQDLALTKRTRFNFFWNTDKEYQLGLKYVVARNFALSGSYDSDYGWGAGISLIY
jgi:CopA family copper-resistance protein